MPTQNLHHQRKEYSESDRVKLAKMATTLFKHWGLAIQDQLALLGLSEGNRGQIRRYEKGEPLGKSRDLLDRVGLLLAIHKNLRLLYPHDRELAYAWMSKRNRALDGFTPVEVIREQGFIGLHHVRAYLDQARGR